MIYEGFSQTTNQSRGRRGPTATLISLSGLDLDATALQKGGHWAGPPTAVQVFWTACDMGL